MKKRMKLSVYSCMKVKEAIADEKKGIVFYRKMGRQFKKEGVRTPRAKTTQASRDEMKHLRWMKELKKKYCSR